MYHHLTMGKQMTDVKLIFYGYIAMIETISLCANKTVFDSNT